MCLIGDRIEMIKNGNNGMGDAHLHWHLYPRRNGDIKNYGNNGKVLVQWYPMDKMYSDYNRPFDVELDKMKAK